MSLILVDKLKVLNIQNLEIINPVFDIYDDSKFEALYEAISKSKLRKFVVNRPTVNGRTQRSMEYLLPLVGFDKLHTSKELNDLEVRFNYVSDSSPTLSILNGLPKNLRSLTVYDSKLIKS